MNKANIAHIRKASLSDVATLTTIRLEASLAWGEFCDEIKVLLAENPFSDEQIEHTFVAIINSQTVGLLTFGQECKLLEITGLFILPEFWRQGLGAQLLARVEQHARILQCELIRVVSNPKAQAFYETNGFDFHEITKTDLGTAPLLAKTITTQT